ncbi:hypothetical protein SAMN05421688_3089 [Poseidonocella pacifica]|uniref:Imelysin-like domain-containing protein n=1 Tax=Poseidonocella pacifica TaxID=871651 RepID=A0A1I0YHL5_9RHOB|nr:imelysin family protein [Poseidonocella pacifica]SFB12642.1 hypothetical protein SAMN05421688_3089 [Poseidonocella pacifica]
MRLLLALALLCPLTAQAGVKDVVDGHVLPGTARFAKATAQLDVAASADCTAEAIRPAWNDAYDAWLGISHLQLGPIEAKGRALAIAFWPDTRGLVPRALGSLIAAEDPIASNEESFGEVSVAARGLIAMERLLYDEDFAYDAGEYECNLVRAITHDLSRMAVEIDTEWREDFSRTLLTAGEPGNDTFLTSREADQALYTALLTGLEYNADQRIGRPLGSFDRPRPTRAETWRAGRSLRNVTLSLEALNDLTEKFADTDTTWTGLAFADALSVAVDLDDPIFRGVEEPAGWLKVEILQQRIELVESSVEGEIGAALGLAAGFNSGDGD